jgi:hypothetical protein
MVPQSTTHHTDGLVEPADVRHVGNPYASLLLLVCGMWLSTNRQFYAEALASSFFAFALAGAIIIYLRLLSRRLVTNRSGVPRGSSVSAIAWDAA